MGLENGVVMLLILCPHMNSGFRNCFIPASPVSLASTGRKNKPLSYRRGVFPILDPIESIALCDIPLKIIKLLARDLALVPAATLFVSEH